jgi:uracil-DNA glycosylase family 4
MRGNREQNIGNLPACRGMRTSPETVAFGALPDALYSNSHNGMPGSRERRTEHTAGAPDGTTMGIPADATGSLTPMSDRDERVAQLEAYHREHVVSCVRCPLSEGRTQVVVGNGDPDAAVMFVGEAPGYHEDARGLPFVGQAGKLLDSLLEGIGMSRDGVFVANVLKCRPPGNRDPLPEEIRSCEPHLFRQIALIRPTLVCTLGNFATKLLSGRPDGISRVHGHELPLQIGGHPVLLYPLYHPAAALYTRAMLVTLQEDFARIPGLLSAEPIPPRPETPDDLDVVGAPAGPAPAEPAVEQLGLF